MTPVHELSASRNGTSQHRVGVVVERAIADDLDEIAPIAVECFRGYLGQPDIALEKLSEWLWSPSDRLYLARREDNGEAVGYVDLRVEGGWYRNPLSVELLQIGVTKSARGTTTAGVSLMFGSYYDVCRELLDKGRGQKAINAFVWFAADDGSLHSFYRKFFDKTNDDFGKRHVFGSFSNPEEERLEAEYGREINIRSFFEDGM